MNVIRTFPLVAVSGIVALFGLLARCFAMRDRTACESQVCANDYDGLTVVLRLLSVDEIKATGLDFTVNEGTSETGTWSETSTITSALALRSVEGRTSARTY